MSSPLLLPFPAKVILYDIFTNWSFCYTVSCLLHRYNGLAHFMTEKSVTVPGQHGRYDERIDASNKNLPQGPSNASVSQ